MCASLSARVSLALAFLVLLPVIQICCEFASKGAPRRRRFQGSAAYKVEVRGLPRELVATFVQSEADAETSAFLTAGRTEASSYVGRWRIFFKHKLYMLLIDKCGWTRVDASAYVRRAQMHVASSAQLGRLLERAQLPTAPSRLLDVGSGLGHVTSTLASALHIADPKRVVALESSGPLRRELENRWGFRAAASFADAGTEPFEVVSLLNVLDRCDDPVGLLQTAARLLQPRGGLLIIATVLPFRGSVQLPYGKRRSPQQPLNLMPAAFSAGSLPVRHAFGLGARSFIETIRKACNRTTLLAWTRLPYLSSADIAHTHYTLDSALFVLRVDPGSTPPAGRRLSAPVSTLDTGRRLSAIKPCGQPDDIFSWVSSTLRAEGVTSWGKVLDAGTGHGSMCWIVRHSPSMVDAVTAASSGKYSQRVAQAAASSSGAKVNVVLGNWRDEALLAGRLYDVVVSDFLIGAVEMFWPYAQDAMLARLTKLVRPGGYLLFLGLEPYDLLLAPKDPLRKVEALGDAAAMLAGAPSYREMPEAWVLRQLRGTPGFRVVSTRQFTSTLGPRYAQSQLEFAAEQAGKLDDPVLRAAILQRAAAMRTQAASFGGRGRNYAIVARREP